MANRKSLIRKMRSTDPISHSLWKEYIAPFVKQSVKRTRDLRSLLSRGPLPGNENPVIKKLFKDGRGMDGHQSAMMTFSYLAALCKDHERKLMRLRQRKTKTRRQ